MDRCDVSLGEPPESGRRILLGLGYGFVCHLSFAAGVAAMISAMFFGMSRSLGSVPAPWSWVANGALLVQFPLLHSLLLTAGGRALLARLAPRGAGSTLSVTIYVTVAGLQVLAVFALWTPSGTIWWQAGGPVRILLTALYAASWLLLGKAMADSGLALQTGSMGWVALVRGRRPVYPRMPDSGLFRMTRQPIYVAFTLTLWTVPVWTPDQLAVAVVLTAYCLGGPVFKESRFRRIYGAEFDEYARGIPYWLPRRPRRGARQPAGGTKAPGQGLG